MFDTLNTQDPQLDAQSVVRLSRDLAKAAATLSDKEARYLVDAYYMMQEDRKRSDNQIRALSESEEPHTVIQWLATQSSTLESQIKRALDKYTIGHPMGEWMRQVVGIGPVISAGLLSNIDITRAPTVGHIWAFAGLDPTRKWEKGQKRPHNAALKRLCWLIGESFVKVKAHEDDVYGKLYEQRKTYEHQKNEALEYADQAAKVLARVPNHAQKETYLQGKLPDGHIHMRAKRWAVKQFLSDLHGAWYWQHYGKEPPLPYPIAILGHAHMRAPGLLQTVEFNVGGENE